MEETAFKTTAEEESFERAKKSRDRLEAAYDNLPAFDLKPICKHCKDTAISIKFVNSDQVGYGECNSFSYMYYKHIEVRRPGKIAHECGRCGYKWETKSAHVDPGKSGMGEG